jgi:hypothetical protein
MEIRDPRPPELAETMDSWFADRDQSEDTGIAGPDGTISAPLDYSDEDVAIYRDAGAGVLDEWANRFDIDLQDLDEIMTDMANHYHPDSTSWIVVSPVVFRKKYD